MIFGNIDLKSGGSTPGSPLSMIHVYIPEAKSTQIQTTMESEKSYEKVSTNQWPWISQKMTPFFPSTIWKRSWIVL